MNNLILFFLFISSIHFSKSEKLIFASLHSRHGARAPLNCDENSIDFLGEKWDNPGELTPTGLRMEYILGLRNRQRYITEKKFLSDKFDNHEVLIYSTNVNRTILSMSAQLQGLYPMYSKSGYDLNDDQIQVSIPPVNISFDEIKAEIDNLNTSALPNYMTLIPIHVSSSSERKMNVHDSSSECSNKVNKTRDNNKAKKETIINAAKDFNKKYSKNLNLYYDKNPKNFEYEFDWIGLFCDTLVSDYSDGRKMEDFFERTNINQKEFLKDCRDIVYTNFRDDFYGDDNNEVILLQESSLIKEVLHYMKLRIDADIKGEDIAKNVSDYSRPKMLIYSGHDATLTAEELFMIKYFGKSIDDYVYPTYTTQLAFEVTRDDEKPSKIDYTSYKVTFYFNDKDVFSVNFEKFKNTIEKNIWNEEQIDEFCGLKKEEDQKSSSNAKLYVIIVLSILCFAFIIIIIILFLKLKSMKENEGTPKGEENEKEKGLVNEDEN